MITTLTGGDREHGGESSKFLTQVFIAYYVSQCRMFQLMRNSRPTFRVVDSKPGEANYKLMQQAMRSLVRRGYNPLQVIKFMFRRYYGVHAPSPPKLKSIMSCAADPATLHEEAVEEAKHVITCDQTNLKQMLESAEILFEDRPHEHELLAMFVPQCNSSVLRAALAWELEGDSGVDKATMRQAVAEYLMCPEVYLAVDMRFIQSKLKNLQRY